LRVTKTLNDRNVDRRRSTRDDGARSRRDAMAYAGYAPGHRVVERTPLERALRAIARPETLDLLERLSKNVARAPSEAKYRKLKRANATIGREIFDDERAMRAMTTMGWIAETIEGSECLTLPRGTTTTMREVRAMDEARTALRRRLEEEMRAKIRARAMANDPRRAALREAVEADRAERAVREPVTTGSRAAARGTGTTVTAKEVGASGSSGC